MKPLLKWAMPFWLSGAIAVVIIIVSLLGHSATVSAAPEKEAPLECLRCHTRALKDHDKLGLGSEACLACHDSRTMGMLRLPDSTQLPLADSNPLCGECHSEHYKAWKKDKHGVLAWNKGKPEILGAKKPKCVGCHSAHQPKIELSKGILPLSTAKSGLGDSVDCLSCHARTLESHDKLGSGSKACWACHFNMEMGVLHLRLSLRLPIAGGGERLKMSDYPQLCAQCHQARYQDWLAGTHGIPAWEVGTVDVHGIQRVGCIGCHDPHQPRVSFSNITLPHPPVQPPASPPSSSLLALFGTALLLAIGAGVAIVKKGEWL